MYILREKFHLFLIGGLVLGPAVYMGKRRFDFMQRGGTYSITGELGFPHPDLPALRVCAESAVEKSVEPVCVQVAAGVKKYQIDVVPGQYYVFAETLPAEDSAKTTAMRAYYSDFVTCGMGSDCLSHRKVVVNVKEDVKGINPVDWYE